MNSQLLSIYSILAGSYGDTAQDSLPESYERRLFPGTSRVIMARESINSGLIRAKGWAYSNPGSSRTK